MEPNERERRILESIFDAAKQCLDEAHLASRMNDVKRVNNGFLELSFHARIVVHLMDIINRP